MLWQSGDVMLPVGTSLTACDIAGPPAADSVVVLMLRKSQDAAESR